MDEIAIIGMSCLFPDASSPWEFYDRLIGNKCFENTKLSSGPYFDPKAYQSEFQVPDGLDEVFDITFYVVGEALKDSGLLGDEEVLNRTGLLIGNRGSISERSRLLFDDIYDIALEDLKTNFELDDLRRRDIFGRADDTINPLNSFSASYPSVMAAKIFGVGGISYSFDAACASTIYALKLASLHLMDRNVDVMLAGGTFHSAYRTLGDNLQEMNVATDFDNFRPLDRNSKGMMACDGAGMFVLKRLPDAVAAGDNIYGTITEIGWASDGESKFLLAPEEKGQLRSLKSAYKGFSNKVDYIECHMTGTPVGDQVEINALESFFADQETGIPAIGAGKRNTGHFMTASVCPSLIKVLLSMKEGNLPATIGVESAISSNKGLIDKEKMVLTNRPWPRRGKVKVAGISAFGFGGINAHMVVKEYVEGSDIDASVHGDENASISIIGIGLRYGGLKDLREFNDSMFFARENKKPLDTRRWGSPGISKRIAELVASEDSSQVSGSYIDELLVDLTRHKIYANSNMLLLYKDLVNLHVASMALEDAGYQRDGREKNIAVLVVGQVDFCQHRVLNRALIKGREREEKVHGPGYFRKDIHGGDIYENEYYLRGTVEGYISHVGSMVGSRIANDWNLIGPTLKISSFETGIPKALQVAKLVLASGDVDSVLLLGYGMCGDAENYVWHKKYGHQFGLKYDSEQFFGDGFGAVVLARKDECERLEFRAYADVVDISIASSPSAEVRGSVIDTQRIEREISRGVSVDYKNIRYVELFGAIGKDESQIIVDACKGKFEFGSGRHIKIGSAIDVIGICEAGSAMASLIKTALAIYFQYLPGSPRAERSDPEKRKSGSRYWVGRGDRSALLIGLGMDDTYGSVTLVQNTNKMNCSRLTLPYFDIRLIPIYGESHKAIKEALAELVRRLGEPADLAEIAKAAYDKFLRQTSSNEIGGYAATLLGTCKEEVIDEIDTVLNYLSKHDELTMFKSNNGSCVAKYRLFSSSEAIAMLFPPFGTLDIVKQQETIFTFPELATLADETVGSGLVQLPSTLVSMFAIHILRERFGIYPGAAIGFSMGELNMALATKFLRISNDKRNDILKGDEENRNSVREKMGEMLGLFQKGGYVSSKYPGETENWATYYLHLTENEELGDLKKKILSRKNVYITIVGHSRAVIVAGDERECKSLISELKCFSTKIYQHGFAHTPFVEACMPRLKSLIKSLSLEIHEDDAFTLYSTYARRPVQIEFDSYIDDVAKSLCYPVEIDKMLLHAANQGVRLFIDTGIDRFCASIAEVVLKDSEVVIESMNAKQNSVERTIASMLATVVSTGVESDISSIFPKVAVKSNAKNIIAYVVNGETSVRWSKVNTQIKDQSVVGKNAFSELGSPSAALSYVKTVAGRREIEHLANQQRSIPIQIEHSNTLESSVSDISCLHNKYLILQRSYSDFIYGQLYNKLCMTGDLQLCVPTGDRVKDALTYEEVIEVSQGKPSSVLGPRYKELDGQKVRARLPLPPFLFITRIKSITAEFGKFGEAAIEGEYVATANRDFYQENISSSVMLHEISQCGILLLSYMGIDIVLPGERSYRALSGTIEYFNPINLFPGKVIYFSYKITSIISFKDRMIVNFAMDLFCGNLHVLTKTGVGGIFTKEDLLSSAKSLPQNGFNNNRTENSTSRQSVRVEPICNKTTFSDWDLLSLQNGRPSICFGHAMAEAVQEQLYPKALKMLDRVCRVDMKGGRFGNGYVETETDIDIDHWAFDVHFKNDPVFPGNILCAGAQQAALFYLTLVGLRRLSNVKLHRHEVLPNNPSSSRFLRQVSRSKCTVRYNLDIKWIGLEPSRIVWDYRVTLGGNLILRGENVGIRLMEFDE